MDFRDRNFADIRRAEAEAREALRGVRANESVAEVAARHEEAMERAKREAIQPIPEFAKQLMKQVAASGYYPKLAEDVREATSGARADTVQRIMQNSGIADTHKALAEQALQRFSTLDTNEAVGRSIRQAVEQAYRPVGEASAKHMVALANHAAAQLFDSPSFRSTLEEVNATLSRSVRPEALSAARYMASEGFLQGKWFDADAQSAVQAATSRLHDNYQAVLNRALDLAADPVVREMVERADREDFVAEAAGLLLADELANTSSAPSAGAATLKAGSPGLAAAQLNLLVTLILYFVIALAVAAATYQYPSYVEQLRETVTDLTVVVYEELSQDEQPEAETKETE